MEEEKTIDTVPFTKLKKLVEQIEQQPHLADRLEETDLTVEFIIGSLFPNLYHNMMEALKDEHTKGYIEGFNSGISNNPNMIKFEPITCPVCKETTYFAPEDKIEPYCPVCGEPLNEH